ncbi:MAG: hypothetical protein LBT44_07150 [Clostridiales bacterium]|jgi:hypothetical protein|nr:hypothetical protein [Clostridiales bacterium]
MDGIDDFGKIVEQAKLISQLMGMGKNNAPPEKESEKESEEKPEKEPEKKSEEKLEEDRAENNADTEPEEAHVHTDPPEASNDGAESGENHQSTDDGAESFQKALRIMQLFQTMSAASNPAEPSDAPPPDEEPPAPSLTRSEARPSESQSNEPRPKNPAPDFARLFDQSVNTSPIQAMKAALPYVDAQHQKMMGFWIKICEIQSLLEMYRNDTQLLYRFNPREKDWRRGMLLSIRPHMSGENQNKIDFFLKLLEIKEVMDKLEGKAWL